jgi:hypothetical protein
MSQTRMTRVRMTRTQATRTRTTEIRYRRLLRLYPEPYRQEYADEMLGVLMADDRPGFGATVDLVRSALSVRFRGGRRALHEPAWRAAAAVVQFSGAILLLAVALRQALMGLGQVIIHAGPVPPHFAVDTWWRPGVWLAVILCALFRERVLGLLLAAAGVSVEIAVAFRYYADTPALVLNAFGIVVTAVLVMLSFLLVEASAGLRPRAPSGWLPATLAGVAVAMTGCAYYVLPRGVGLTSSELRFGGRWTLITSPILWGWSPILLGAAVLLLLAAWLRLEPAVRRRVVACAVPVLVTKPSVGLGFGGFRAYNAGHPEALHLISPVQWVFLLVIPVVAFAAAVELNRRLEQTRFRESATRTSKSP